MTGQFWRSFANLLVFVSHLPYILQWQEPTRKLLQAPAVENDCNFANNSALGAGGRRFKSYRPDQI
jgi:hypothetical protein